MKPHELNYSVKNVLSSCKPEKLVPIVEQGREGGLKGSWPQHPDLGSLASQAEWG